MLVMNVWMQAASPFKCIPNFGEDTNAEKDGGDGKQEEKDQGEGSGWNSLVFQRGLEEWQPQLGWVSSFHDVYLQRLLS